MLNNLTSKQSGFAMMEVLITAIIVAIGISGVGVLLLRSIQATQDSAQQSQAMWITQDFVGKLRANSSAAKNSAYVGDIDISDCATPPTICASYNKNGTVTDATANCSTAAMAAFDMWTTVCGIDGDSFDTPSDFIANPSLSNTCLERDTRNDCVRYSVTFSWDIKIAKGSPEADERTNTNDYNIIVEVN